MESVPMNFHLPFQNQGEIRFKRRSVQLMIMNNSNYEGTITHNQQMDKELITENCRRNFFIHLKLLQGKIVVCLIIIKLFSFFFSYFFLH